MAHRTQEKAILNNYSCIIKDINHYLSNEETYRVRSGVGEVLNTVFVTFSGEIRMSSSWHSVCSLTKKLHGATVFRGFIGVALPGHNRLNRWLCD